MAFTHLSHKACSLLRRLEAATAKISQQPQIISSQIAQHVKALADNVPLDSKNIRCLEEEMKTIDVTLDGRSSFSSLFTSSEVEKAIRCLKLRKVGQLYGVFPEFIIHLGKNGMTWSQRFFSNCLRKGQVPADFKISETLAILKPGKPKDDPSSDRPIALLSVCYRLLEWFIYNMIYQTVESKVPS